MLIWVRTPSGATRELLPVGGRPYQWLQMESKPRLALPNIDLFLSYSACKEAKIVI